MRSSMSQRTGARRILAVALMLLGAALLFLAPETSTGLVLLALGVLLELIGMSISHHRRARLRHSDDSS